MFDAFRYTGFAEGVSYLLLLGVAMPLKYLADVPEPVTVVGWVHGLLFMVYVGFAAWLRYRRMLSTRWMLGCFVAALLPFGPFVIDARMPRGAGESYSGQTPKDVASGGRGS
jgi:integral membrane protein